MTADDWNTSRRLPDQVNCTNTAASITLRVAAHAGELAQRPGALVAGQSQVVHHPDEVDPVAAAGGKGAPTARQWGSAADATHVYVAHDPAAVPNSR
jgi:hypothetical protein